ncbi:MAG: hypothetical protein JO250_02530, partial [Armatimonadetes bacterium]|nr:hypothetical protein [Armatimonadota bacterium]
MFTITNPKVAGFLPRWARFRGFSILFDSPGDCLTPSGERLDLACDVDADAELGFYRSLRDSLSRLNPNLLTATYLFCPLPPPSYHVTAWDGGNDGNVARVVPEHRPKLEHLLAGLPDALVQPHELTELASASPLVRRRDWNIRFRFERPAIWGNEVLVAHLTPIDSSRAAFQEFTEERRRLTVAFRQAFGIGPSDNYTPHVSLGYFANREGAQLAIP